MSSIRQLRTLDAVYRHRSFAQAARALNLTQSTVSMQVAALEEAMGVTVFDRRHRPPKLTKAGEVVLKHARVIVAQFDEMKDAITDVRSYRGKLRLGVIPTALTNLLPAALFIMRQQHPSLVVNVLSELSGDLVDMVARREIDAALMHCPRDLAADFEWREVTRQRLVIVTPPGSTAIEPAEVFKKHPYIRFNRSAWVAGMIEARLEELGISPKAQAEIQSVEAIHLMVNLGFGASILPDVGGGDDSLRLLDFGTPPLYRTVGILSRRDLPMKRATAIAGDAFLQAALERSGVVGRAQAATTSLASRRS